jgi:uncharacterized protein YndB with AHSA1/START domain
MAEYHFVTTYQIEAPIEQVWQAFWDFDRYPTWSKGIFHAQQLRPGDAVWATRSATRSRAACRSP